MIELRPHQKEALENLRNGCILYGGTGSGKSLTAIAYYVKHEAPKDVYVITTAKKRDSLDWNGEGARFGVSTDRASSVHGKLSVDSWNNIGKYVGVKDAFFIFDEQRVIGSGAWVKSFLKIAESNRWLVLSATPGDAWIDYGPVFVANGWYRNLTDFKRQHVVYAPYVKYPQIAGYLNEDKLHRMRNMLLVEMPYHRHTTRHLNWLDVGFDKELIKKVLKERWHYVDDRPLTDVADLWRYCRAVVNSDVSRLETIRELLRTHPRLIVWYTFNYELDILRGLSDEFEVREWNGHKHERIPDGESWVYLVQYAAGSEGWNCIETDAMAFYSLTGSYRTWAQAQGRIDRLNTPYTNLYYYMLVSGSKIDSALRLNLYMKKEFNERREMAKWASEEGLPAELYK